MQNAILRERIRDFQRADNIRFNWPWESWNKFIRPLRKSMVGVITAPDGMGKTTYLEEIAEYWAKIGWQVVYVHLEDSFDYKMDRRDARISGVHMWHIEDGELSPDEQVKIAAAHEEMAGMASRLHYYHAAGKSMLEIMAELEARCAEGVCQAVVLDYIDKVQATRGQLKAYGDNAYERQANDMELLKTFAEVHDLPILTATQGNKDMYGAGVKTRQNIAGSIQKSQKAQLVVILTRDIVGPDGLYDVNGKHLADPGEYNPLVNVRVDKQNRGRTGSFFQRMIGEYFRIRDIPAGGR